MLKPTLLALVASTSLVACVDEPPNFTLSLHVEVPRDIDDKEAIGAVRLGSSNVAEVRTVLGLAVSDVYIPEDDLGSAQACVRLRSWSYGSTCAGCPERRDYYDLIDEVCEPLVLSGADGFTMVAAETDKNVTFFVEPIAD